MGLYETIDSEDLRDYHPTVLVAAVAPTLESLSLSYLNIEFETWMLWDPPLRPAVVSPNLTRLELQDEWPVLGPYIRAFPNLTHISMRPHRDLHDYAEGVLGHDLAAEEHRQANVVDQLVDEQSKWVHLQEFSGNPIGLYLAGLLCRIPRINLEPIEDQDVIHVLDPVLSSARPTELDVAVRGLLIHDT